MGLEPAFDDFAARYKTGSVEGGATIGRYSFITLKPDLVWRCFGSRAEINRQARAEAGRFEPLEGEALESLRALVQESQIDLPDNLPPMASCLIGYMGYDMVRLMERLPSGNPDVLGLPDAVFFRPTLVAVFDRVEDLVTIVTPVWPSDGISAEAAYQQAPCPIAANPYAVAAKCRSPGPTCPASSSTTW
jgi:anthranilate synthase component 1